MGGFDGWKRCVRWAAVAACLTGGMPMQAAEYYLDSDQGNDGHAGTSPMRAWKSLQRASAHTYEPGDVIHLRRGGRFEGSLRLQLNGTRARPIRIMAYGSGDLPLIEASGEQGGVHLVDSRYVQVRDLAITANRRGKVKPTKKTFGVFLEAKQEGFSHLLLRDLKIYDVYASKASEHEGFNPTTSLGTGIGMYGLEGKASHVVVRNCEIQRTGYKAIEMRRVQQVKILDNRMKDIGGPAIQPGRVQDLLVRGNVVDGSGSSLDPRMHARGSGIWPWSSERILIEHNTFMGARGKGDSCGIHIDFNCRDVVVQYNLSVDNEGGFAEILGNNHNCAYRYNISVNDGARRKGVNRAFQEGKVLWTSGFTGRGNKQHGPYHSYIYNNTVYVKGEAPSRMSFAPSTDGLLIANNIFYIEGPVDDVTGDQARRRRIEVVEDPVYVVSHNLVAHAEVFPDGVPFEALRSVVGDPQFRQPGGRRLQDYIPQNHALIRDAGMKIEALPGDEIGLRLGLEVKQDILGNPVRGLPDLGAIELPPARAAGQQAGAR